MMLLQRAKNSDGFTLIELMISVVIIMVSMLALLTAILTSITTNQVNEIRNTSVRVTNLTAESLLALTIDDPELTATLDYATNGRIASTHVRSSGDTTQDLKGFPVTVQTVRNYQVTYVIQWEVKQVPNSAKQVSIDVTYTYKGKSYSNVSVIYKT